MCRITNLLALVLLCLPQSPLAAVGPAERLVLHPAALTLHGPHDRQGFLATLHGPDGRLRDVTAEVRCTLSRPGVVSLVSPAECEALTDGEVTLTVEQGGRTAVLPITVRAAGKVEPPSFIQDVEPLFTRLGCNQGACHGKGAGQNGFRLSLRGYAPEQDHRWLTRELQSRRVSPSQPGDSLLLRKPLGQAAHEGGKLFSAGSRPHAILLAWLKAGMPGPRSDEPSLRRLEVLPGSRMLQPGQTQQLRVRAEYSNGRWRDVTWLSRFDSNDAGMAEVSSQGLVRVLRPGETAIRASFQGLVGVVIITAPHDKPVDPQRLAARNNLIDEHVFRKLEALRIEPSDLCSDGEFLRRAFLDTVGILPTPEEVRAFLADKQPDKRARLVDALLARPEFVDYWALQLGDLLQNRKERDHDVRGSKGVRAFHTWLREQVARNRPWDELAREVLTATGKTSESPAVGYFIVTMGEQGQAESSEVAASVAQAFLGTRIGCAKCHNHPLEKYTQDDYYHFAAFFSRVGFERHEPKDGQPTLLRIKGADGKEPEAKAPVTVTQPRTGQPLGPQPLDRSKVSVKPGDDPRRALAGWMTDPSNEYFKGAIVNRIWRHFLGVGLVEPVDDLRASNPPSNPELWQALTQELVIHHYDLKHLMRLILTSRTYQLSSTTRPSNRADSRFYSHYYARRLPAEVLLDVLSQATEIPEDFPGYPRGIRAVQMPDPALKSYFLSLFGRSERVTACACERNGEVTMPQMLHLLNGASVVDKVRANGSRFMRLMESKKTDTEILEELFLATLSRLPTDAERAAVARALAKDYRGDVFYDLFWVLLNTKELAFNH